MISILCALFRVFTGLNLSFCCCCLPIAYEIQNGFSLYIYGQFSNILCYLLSIDGLSPGKTENSKANRKEDFQWKIEFNENRPKICNFLQPNCLRTQNFSVNIESDTKYTFSILSISVK